MYPDSKHLANTSGGSRVTNFNVHTHTHTVKRDLCMCDAVSLSGWFNHALTKNAKSGQDEY